MILKHMLSSLLLLLLFCCSPPVEVEPVKDGSATRSELFSAMRNAGSILIVYPDADTALAAFISAYIAPLQQQQSSNRTYILVSDKYLKESDLKEQPAILVGVFPNGLPYLDQQQLPFQIDRRGIHFDDRVYREASDVMRISCYPNPLNQQMPLGILTGNSEEAVLKYLQSIKGQDYGFLLLDSWGYQVIRDNQRLVLGNYATTDSMRWTIDHERHWEFDYKGNQVKENNRFRYIDHASGLTDIQLDSIEQYSLRISSHLEDVLGISWNKKYDYHLYKSTEIKGLMLNNTAPAHVNFSNMSVHGVYEHEFGEHYAGAESQLLLREMLGMPKVLSMEMGAAAYFNEKWEEQGAIYWGLLLYHAGAAPDLATLLNNEKAEIISPLLRTAAAAVWVQFLLETLSKDDFKRLYTTAGTSYWMPYAKAYEAYVDSLLQDFKRLPTAASNYGFLKGFNFAHEGYEVYNGYIGTEAALSLKELRTTGCNALAIIPYTYTGELKKPAPFPFVQSAGAENDASVIKSAHVASELGMKVLLKPQIWSWKGWPGDFEMSSQEYWGLFFQYYSNWIYHYALLAEMYHMDMFCAGVEFQQATLQQPEAWKHIIHVIKQLYGGPVTYAANWGAEFEQSDIWDELDFMSVNFYYPLSKKENPDDAELLKTFEKQLDVLEGIAAKKGKPLLITEIGYTSTSQPWLKPHSDNDEYDTSEAAQKRCYEIMFQALSDEDWIKGMFLWQWPSYLDYTARNPSGFTPAGKEAEAVVRQWYGQKWSD